MSEQIVNTPAQQPVVPATSTATTPVTTGEETYTKAQVEQMLKDRMDRANTKAAELAQKAADQAKADAAAKNGEWEALAKQREKEAGELKARLDALEISAKKRAIGAKFGLPDELAQRLAGGTDEELEADAKKLQALIPAPAPKSPGPINPGANGGGVTETDAQRLQRIHGTQSNAWVFKNGA